MVTDWIIIGAIVVLLAGVILAFRTADQDTDQRSRKSRTKPRRGTKRVTGGH